LIDLNCDMGEIEALHADGTQRSLLEIVTSVNIACGAHAGDETLARATLAEAHRAGVRCGAHPGYPDRANFGRMALALSGEEIASTVEQQVRWLAALAGPIPLTHVKPHGALYNVAARDAAVARAIARGVARWRRDVTLVGLARSVMIDAFREEGFPVWREAFADRAYEPDGTLRPRHLPGALLTDPAAASAQARVITAAGWADTLCVHSDTPHAVEIARAIRTAA
jgi:UPF0271 protein